MKSGEDWAHEFRLLYENLIDNRRDNRERFALAFEKLLPLIREEHLNHIVPDHRQCLSETELGHLADNTLDPAIELARRLGKKRLRKLLEEDSP